MSLLEAIKTSSYEDIQPKQMKHAKILERSTRNELYPSYLKEYNPTEEYKSRSQYTEMFVNNENLLNGYRNMLSSHPNYLRFSSHPNDIPIVPNFNEKEKENSSFILQMIQKVHEPTIIPDYFKTGEIKSDDKFRAIIGSVDGKIYFFKMHLKHIEEQSEIEMINYAVSLTNVRITCSLFIKGDSETCNTSENGAVITALEDGQIIKWDLIDARSIASYNLFNQTIISIQALGPNDAYLLIRIPSKTLLFSSVDLQFLLDITQHTGYAFIHALTTNNQGLDNIPVLFMDNNQNEISLGYLNLIDLPSSTIINSFSNLNIFRFNFNIVLNDFIPINCDSIICNTNNQLLTSDKKNENILMLLYSYDEFLLIKTNGMDSMHQIYSSKKLEYKISKALFLSNNLLLISDNFNSPEVYKLLEDHSLTLLYPTNQPIKLPYLNNVYSILYKKDVLNPLFIILNLSSEQSNLILNGFDLSSLIDNKLKLINGKYLNNNNNQNKMISTFMTPVTLGFESCYNDWIAKGYIDGNIILTPLYKLFDDNDNNILIDINKSEYKIENESAKLLLGHSNPITWLLEPAPSRLNTKLLLLSADSIGLVKLWELSTGICLASFQNHNCSIIKMFQLPLPTNQNNNNIKPKDNNLTKLRISQLVFSLGSDNSLSVLDLKKMICLGSIPGNLIPIYKIIYYSNPQPIFKIIYKDNSFIYLNLNLNSISLSNHILDDNINWECGVKLINNFNNEVKPASTSIFSYFIKDLNCAYPIIRIFEIDLKRLSLNLQNNTTPSIRFFTGSIPIYPNNNDVKDRRGHIVNYSSASIVRTTKFPINEDKINVSKHLLNFIYKFLTNSTFESTQDIINNNYTSAIKGVNEYLSYFIINDNDNNSNKLIWCISPYYTAIRLLPILSIAKSILSEPSNEIQVITNYGSLLKETIGDQFQSPSLEYLIKFWKDKNIELQNITKSLFLSTFNQLSQQSKFKVLFYFQSLLPEVLPEDLIYSNNCIVSTIVSAILLIEFPNLICDSHIIQLISHSLEWFVCQHANIKYRLIALDILNRGYKHFETYLDGIIIFKNLYYFINENNVTLNELSLYTLLNISVSNPPLLISSFGLTNDIIGLQSILKFIPFIINKRKAFLFNYISPTVEVILKALDPKDQDRAHTLLLPATQCIHDLVNNYNIVDFHPGTQRLAVGVKEGAAIIYDLRTCTRYLVLEGYLSPITNVCFSPDGKLLATFSLVEQILKVWYTSAGLFSMLTKSLRSITPTPNRDYKLSNSPPSVNSIFSLDNTNNSFSAPTSGRNSPHNNQHANLGFLNSSPSPYRTFNVKMDDHSDSIPVSPTTIMQSAELSFSANRSIKLVVNGLEMCFNI